MITQEDLQPQLDYDQDTGVFTRLIANSNSVKVGEAAGSTRKADGYVFITINNKKYPAHRLAFLYMEGKVPVEIDHINHIRDDNRWCNLRAANTLMNNRNHSLSKANTSGFNGVHWDKYMNKWCAQINTDYKPKHLGYFDCIEDAVAARKAADAKYGFHPNHGKPALSEKEAEYQAACDKFMKAQSEYYEASAVKSRAEIKLEQARTKVTDLEPKETITAHGIEHDDLVTEPLEEDTRFFIANPTAVNLFEARYWNDGIWNMAIYERQLAHHTKQGAVRHARHMLGEK